MALVVSDRVKETTTSTGTGTINLGGVVNSSFETFVAGVGDSNTTYYAIIDTANGDFEVGLGTVTDATPDTLSRDTVLESSNSDNKVNFSAGTKTVICTQPADKAVYLDSSGKLVVDGSAVDYLDKSGGTMTGALTLSGAPTDDNHAVTKTYVDDLIAAGIHYHTPVRVESPVSAGNINATYNNGTNGVGATLTNAGTQAVLVLDGVTLVLNDRVLIYNQTDATENGIYTVTNVGSASTNWVLTRATDADSYGVDNDSLSEGTSVFVTEGDDGSGDVYACTTTGTITFGTTAINFAQIGRSAVLEGGTGITVSDNTISVTDNSIGATQLNVSGNGDTDKFLRSDGDGSFSWVTPTDTDTIPNNATVCICANTCLTGGGTFTVDQSAASTICIDHADTSTLTGAYGGNDNGVVIEDMTVDGYGHVTAVGTRDLDCRYNFNCYCFTDCNVLLAPLCTGTIAFCGAGATSVSLDAASSLFTICSTDTNTDTTYGLTAEQTGGTNADPNLVLDGSSGTDSCVQLVGSGATTVTRNCDGKITISSTDNNTDTNTTYSISAETVTDGANLRLTDSGSTTDDVSIIGGTNVTVTRTDADTITICSTDTNTDTTYTAGTGLTLDGTEFDVNVNATAQTTAANTVSSTASRTYAVQVDGSDNLVVNVPWTDTDTDTDTTYTAGTGLTLDGTEFDVNVASDVQTTAANSVTTTANRTYAVQVNNTDDLVVNVPWSDTDTNTTYSAATSSTLGLNKLGSDTEQTTAANAVSSTASRTYAVQHNSSDQMVVNVPWSDTDTNTTYTAGTNLCLDGTEFSVCDTVSLSCLCAGTLTLSSSGIGRSNTAGITYSAYGSHVFDSTNGYAIHACCNAYALGSRAVKIDEPLVLCVGDCTYNSSSTSKLYGGVEAGSKGIKVNFLMDCSACCHYACLYATEAYTVDSWHLDGYASGYIGTRGDFIRLQHGHGPVGACPMLDVRYACTDVYVCSYQKLKVCNTGACTYGCHCASTCFHSPRVCGTCCVRSPRICGTTCVRTGTLCATSSTQSPYYFVNSASGSSYDYWLPYCRGSAGQVLTVGSGSVSCFCDPQLGVKYVSGCSNSFNSLVLSLCEDWQQLSFVIQSDTHTPGWVNSSPRFDEVHLMYNTNACICFFYTAHTTGGDSCRSYTVASDLFPDTYVACNSVLKYDFWRVPVGTGECYKVHMEGSYVGSGGACTGVPQNDRVFLSGSSHTFVSSTYDCNWKIAICNNTIQAYDCWYAGCCPATTCTIYNRDAEWALKTVLGAACTY